MEEKTNFLLFTEALRCTAWFLVALGEVGRYDQSKIQNKAHEKNRTGVGFRNNAPSIRWIIKEYEEARHKQHIKTK